MEVALRPIQAPSDHSQLCKKPGSG